MNASNAKDYLPLVQALAEGKVIQYKYQKSDKSYAWMDLESNVGFGMPADCYRIKQEPREIWVNEYPDGSIGAGSYKSKRDAEMSAIIAKRFDTKQRRFSEVIE